MSNPITIYANYNTILYDISSLAPEDIEGNDMEQFWMEALNKCPKDQLRVDCNRVKKNTTISSTENIACQNALEKLYAAYETLRRDKAKRPIVQICTTNISLSVDLTTKLKKISDITYNRLIAPVSTKPVKIYWGDEYTVYDISNLPQKAFSRNQIKKFWQKQLHRCNTPQLMIFSESSKYNPNPNSITNHVAEMALNGLYNACETTENHMNKKPIIEIHTENISLSTTLTIRLRKIAAIVSIR